MKIRKSNKNFFLKVIFALIVGFVNGFLGGGGGLLCVPTLEKIYKLETKKAHATTIAVMFPLSIISSIIYLLSNNINLNKTFAISSGVLIGGFIGALTLKKISGCAVRWLFIIILFIAGVRMMV